MLLDNYSIGVILTQILSRWKRLVSRKARFNLFFEKYCESNSLKNIESVDNTELGYNRKEEFWVKIIVILFSGQQVVREVPT